MNGAVLIINQSNHGESDEGAERPSKKPILNEFKVDVDGRFHSDEVFRRNFDSISLKLDRIIVCIENSSCIVFGPNQPSEGGS